MSQANVCHLEMTDIHESESVLGETKPRGPSRHSRAFLPAPFLPLSNVSPALGQYLPAPAPQNIRLYPSKTCLVSEATGPKPALTLLRHTLQVSPHTIQESREAPSFPEAAGKPLCPAQVPLGLKRRLDTGPFALLQRRERSGHRLLQTSGDAMERPAEARPWVGWPRDPEESHMRSENTGKQSGGRGRCGRLGRGRASPGGGGVVREQAVETCCGCAHEGHAHEGPA